ncbi:hypothetical protein B296_00007087 [Ensete ventricosum]|uniref:Uncharacterized protein n=1 Tax=Ensete ventricosum TaxID=4639 RepID=A0A427B1L2_ENSVE|nr:hypothetical protein B296_00007087 [Ensete ventricosum]
MISRVVMSSARKQTKNLKVYEKQMKGAKKTGSIAKQDKIDERVKFVTAKTMNNKTKGKVDDDDAGPTEVPMGWRDYNVVPLPRAHTHCCSNLSRSASATQTGRISSFPTLSGY